MSSKSLKPLDSSDFKIDPEDAKIAFKNFGESDEIRKQSIDLMRNWVEKNPRISRIRLDSNILLYFLRIKKFSVPKAQEAMERCFVVLNCYENDGVNILKDHDGRDEKVQDLLNRG
jgi:hypothetical protein